MVKILKTNRKENTELNTIDMEKRLSIMRNFQQREENNLGIKILRVESTRNWKNIYRTIKNGPSILFELILKKSIENRKKL